MRIALIGNCQTRSFDYLLRRSSTPVETLVMDFSMPESRDEEGRCRYLENLSTVDLVLMQHNGLKYTTPAEVIDHIGRHKVKIVANVFFRGTLPDLCYVGTAGARHGFIHYNSVIALAGYMNGLNVDDCLSLYNREFFLEAGLLKAWETSLHTLRGRDHITDFPVADLSEDCVKNFYCLRAFNHPSLTFLHLYLQNILQALGVNYAVTPYRESDDPLFFLDLPIYDFVAEYFHLPYRTTQTFKTACGVFVSRREFIERSFKAYSETPRESLVINSPADLKENLRHAGMSLFTESLYSPNISSE